MKRDGVAKVSRAEIRKSGGPLGQHLVGFLLEVQERQRWESGVGPRTEQSSDTGQNPQGLLLPPELALQSGNTSTYLTPLRSNRAHLRTDTDTRDRRLWLPTSSVVTVNL